MKIGKPIKYIAVPPNEVLERVKSKVQEEAQAQERSLETLKDSDVLGELSVLHNKGVELVEPTDLTASFRGRNKVYEQINLMLKEAEKDFVLITTAEGLTRKIEFLARAFKKAHERGVTIRIASPINDETKDALSLIAPYVEVREMNHIKARLAIADGEELAFLLFDDNAIHPTYDVGVWVNTPFFAQAILDLFDTTWENLNVVELKN